MKKKGENLQNTQDSLMPLLEAEESRLSEYIDQTKKESERRLSQAEADAALRLEKAVDELKQKIEEERGQRRLRIKTELERARIKAGQALLEFKSGGRSRQEKAVVLILSVLAGGPHGQ